LKPVSVSGYTPKLIRQSRAGPFGSAFLRPSKSLLITKRDDKTKIHISKKRVDVGLPFR
jgi:hypothetical protein